MKNLLLLLVLSGLSACSSTSTKTEEQQAFEARHHAIYINQFGDIKQPDTAPLTEQPVPTSNQAREKAYVDAIVKNIVLERKARPNLKLVMFVHGGLNTFDTAWERANDFSAAMLKEDRYPVFVGWNSGPFTNYFDHLFRIRKGERRPVIGAITSPLVLVEDIARSVVHAPYAWYTLVADPYSITKRAPVKHEQDFNIRMERLGKNFNVTSRPPFDGTGPYLTIANPVKLITAPFLDGLGVGAWDSMLRRTDLVLSRSQAFEGPLEEKTPEGFADTAVTDLLKKIELMNDTKRSDATPIRVDLIGHSMGAIVINNILARHPGLPVDNVVFMAGATPIKDVENGVVPWLAREGNGARFYNLSIDPYREISENFFYDFLPRGSLLHWIDNIFGEVNSFKDRTAGGWWNIVRTAEDVFPVGLRERVHLTRFGIGGSRMGPQRHGEFDGYYFWRKEFWCAESGLTNFDKAKIVPPTIAQDAGCTPADKYKP